MCLDIDVRAALRTAIDDERLSEEALLMFCSLLSRTGFRAGWGSASADWTDSDYAALDELTGADYIYRLPKDNIAAFLAVRFFEV